MHDYKNARTVGQVISIIGWIAISIGGIILLFSFGAVGAGFGLVALASALGIIVGGFLTVAQEQLLRAQVDVASNTANIISLMRDMNRSTSEPIATPLQRINQRLDGIQSTSSHSYMPPSERSQLISGREYNSYRGYDIVGYETKIGWRYKTVGKDFSSLNEAADFVDDMEKK